MAAVTMRMAGKERKNVKADGRENARERAKPNFGFPKCLGRARWGRGQGQKTS